MRRGWTAVAVAIAACGGAPAAHEPAPAEGGRAEPFRIGSMEAFALADGHLIVPNDGTLLAVGAPPDDVAALLDGAGLPRDALRLDVQHLLVRTGDDVVLFDAGTGDPSVAHTGRLLASLALAGVAPADVTSVFVSHAHSDHVGGLLTRDGALAFPAATVHLSAPEWDALRAADDADSRRYAAALAPRVSTFSPGATILPYVVSVPTPGHTPGHSSFLVGGALFYLGDVAHHHVVSVARPAWRIAVDADHAAAATTRATTLAALAASGTRVFAPHFPFPGVGHLVDAGATLAWRPSPPTDLRPPPADRKHCITFRDTEQRARQCFASRADCLARLAADALPDPTCDAVDFTADGHEIPTRALPPR